MSLYEHFISLIIASVLVVGGYQFYFLPQRYAIFPAKEFSHQIEDKIPLVHGWVWIYSGLYYPVFVSTVFVFNDFKSFSLAAFNFLELLFIQTVIFFIFPVATPERWRNTEGHNTYSKKMLELVWRYDSNSNCFPSAHASFSTLSAIYISSNLYQNYGNLSYLIFLYPLLISISAIFTKQHYLIDIPFGIILAISVYYFGKI